MERERRPASNVLGLVGVFKYKGEGTELFLAHATREKGSSLGSFLQGKRTDNIQKSHNRSLGGQSEIITKMLRFRKG